MCASSVIGVHRSSLFLVLEPYVYVNHNSDFDVPSDSKWQKNKKNKRSRKNVEKQCDPICCEINRDRWGISAKSPMEKQQENGGEKQTRKTRHRQRVHRRCFSDFQQRTVNFDPISISGFCSSHRPYQRNERKKRRCKKKRKQGRKIKGRRGNEKKRAFARNTNGTCVAFSNLWSYSSGPLHGFLAIDAWLSKYRGNGDLPIEKPSEWVSVLMDEAILRLTRQKLVFPSDITS